MTAVHNPTLSTPVSRRRLGGLFCGALAAAGLAGCGRTEARSASSPSASSKLSLLLDWNPNPDHVTLYTAVHTGAFTKEGIEVGIQNPANTADAAKQVSLGQVDLAVSYEPDTLIAVGQGLDVISVAALIPVSLTSLIAKKSRGITSGAQLKGRTVGLSGLASQRPSVEYIARRSGVDPATITMPNIQQSLSQALLTDKVDAIYGGFRNIEGIELAEKVPVDVMPATELGLPDYAELVIIASRRRLAQEKGYAEKVRAFLRGLAAGQSAAQKDHSTAAEAMTAPTRGSYQPQMVAKMVDATVGLLGTGPFGVQKPADWAAFATWMHRNGLLDKALDGASGTTNDYLPA